jgi:hypothetical protein
MSMPLERDMMDSWDTVRRRAGRAVGELGGTTLPVVAGGLLGEEISCRRVASSSESSVSVVAAVSVVSVSSVAVAGLVRAEAPGGSASSMGSCRVAVGVTITTGSWMEGWDVTFVGGFVVAGAARLCRMVPGLPNEPVDSPPIDAPSVRGCREMGMPRMETSEDCCFLWTGCQRGALDRFAGCATGVFGIDDGSTKPCSSMEYRGFESGEVGTEEGAKSDGCSENSDHRFVDGPDVVEIESRVVWERSPAMPGPSLSCCCLHCATDGVGGDEPVGGVKTSAAMIWRFLGFLFSALWATW